MKKPAATNTLCLGVPGSPASRERARWARRTCPPTSYVSQCARVRAAIALARFRGPVGRRGAGEIQGTGDVLQGMLRVQAGICDGAEGINNGLGAWDLGDIKEKEERGEAFKPSFSLVTSRRRKSGARLSSPPVGGSAGGGSAGDAMEHSRGGNKEKEEEKEARRQNDLSSGEQWLSSAEQWLSSAEQ